MDIWVLVRDKGYFCESSEYFKEYGDTKLSEVGQIFGDICPFFYGYWILFSKYLKGYEIPGTLPPTHTHFLGPHYCIVVFNLSTKVST